MPTVQYGPRAKAAMVNLTCGQFVSVARTAELLTDMLGVAVPTGSVAAAQTPASGGLDSVIDTIVAGIAAAEVVHADETGLRVADSLHWGHSLSTDTLSLLNVHPKRGRGAFDEAGVIPGLSGTLVHDAESAAGTVLLLRGCVPPVLHRACAPGVDRGDRLLREGHRTPALEALHVLLCGWLIPDACRRAATPAMSLG